MSDRQKTLFDIPWSGGNEVLLATLSEIGMPNRLVTLMKNEGVLLVGTFVQLDEKDVFRKQSLGEKSLRKAGKILKDYGLFMGMALRGWEDDLAAQARIAMGCSIRKRIFELKPTDWIKHSKLEDELKALLLEVEEERNAEILCRFFGFNEYGPCTLESAGQQYGLTRERVRQIAARAQKKLNEIWRPMPCLEEAKTIITSRVGSFFSQKDFNRAVLEAGISSVDFHVEGVLTALDLVGERHSIAKASFGEITVYGKVNEVELPNNLMSALRKETSANGCSNLQRLALLVGLSFDDTNRLGKLLQMSPEVLWLDESSMWLLSKGSQRNRLANIAAKIFSVSRSVEMNELRKALRRHSRVNFVPPTGALGNLLEHYRIADIKDGYATADAALEPPELGAIDQGLVDAFEALGNPLTREQLEDYCIDELGININSFYVNLTYSPLVMKLDRGVFALVGQEIEPGAINQLKEKLKEHRFVESSGWSKAGTLWWHFQADRPVANSGTKAVPTFVFNHTSGEWRARTIDKLDLGTARIESGFISGLRAAFAALGVANKDFLQVDFDMAKREAYVRIVGDEPEEFEYISEADEFDAAVEPRQDER